MRRLGIDEVCMYVASYRGRFIMDKKRMCFGIVLSPFGDINN